MMWESKQASLRAWHRWFAWYPVRYGDYRIWLETVWRRDISEPEDRSRDWLYKPIFEKGRTS